MDFSKKRYLGYLIVALTVSGAVAVGLSYWAAKAYIAYSHSGDPLEAKGDLAPGQK